VRKILTAGVEILAVPLVVSAPFLVDNAEGFIRSLAISLTRFPETHLGVPSLDALLGLVGVSAKAPLVGLTLALYLLAIRKPLRPVIAAFLTILIFTNFHSVFFRHYMTWLMPLAPLAAGEALRTHK
ncbi:MAG: hypothetical protein D6803_04430, partial [Anaerolineae bacterium]